MSKGFLVNFKEQNFDESDISNYVSQLSFEEYLPDYVDIKHYSVATVPPGVHGRMIFVTDGNAGNPCLAVYDSSGGFYRRIVLGAAVNT